MIVMPISYKHKCIFVHIPKTGGSSILEQLQVKKTPYNLWSDEIIIANIKGTMIKTVNKNFARPQHLPASVIKSLRPDIFDDYYKFSVIRNPYSKMISEYTWRNKFNEDFRLYSNEQHKNNFENYIFSVESEEIKTMREYSQYEYLYDSSGKLLVDDIIKFENFEDDCRKVFKKLGVACEQILHTNKPKVLIDKNYLLDDANKNRIYNLYKIDFDTFGYEK